MFQHKVPSVLLVCPLNPTLTILDSPENKITVKLVTSVNALRLVYPEKLKSLAAKVVIMPNTNII